MRVFDGSVTPKKKTSYDRWGVNRDVYRTLCHGILLNFLFTYFCFTEKGTVNLSWQYSVQVSITFKTLLLFRTDVLQHTRTVGSMRPTTSSFYRTRILKFWLGPLYRFVVQFFFFFSLIFLLFRTSFSFPLLL